MLCSTVASRSIWCRMNLVSASANLRRSSAMRSGYSFMANWSCSSICWSFALSSEGADEITGLDAAQSRRRLGSGLRLGEQRSTLGFGADVAHKRDDHALAFLGQRL